MKRPEKMVQTKEEDNSDWFYGYGYNQAIEKSDAYLDWLLDAKRIADLIGENSDFNCKCVPIDEGYETCPRCNECMVIATNLVNKLNRGWDDGEA